MNTTPSTHNAPFDPQNKTNFISLDSIQIATPCRADWNAMSGDERTRFCGSCQKNVYNFSNMTREEATALIREKEGDVCVRLYRREDGTVITDDCPVGIKVVRRPLKWLLAGFAALMASGAALFGAQAGANSTDASARVGTNGSNQSALAGLRRIEPLKTLVNWIDPVPADVAPPIAGGICPVPPPPAPSPEEEPGEEPEAAPEEGEEAQ